MRWYRVEWRNAHDSIVGVHAPHEALGDDVMAEPLDLLVVDDQDTEDFMKERSKILPVSSHLEAMRSDPW